MARASDSRRYTTMRLAFRGACLDSGTPCWICGQAIDYTAPPNDETSFELDHAFPVSTHPELKEDAGNFRASHCRCNRARGNRPPRFAPNAVTREW